jgi:hypothetical protein
VSTDYPTLATAVCLTFVFTESASESSPLSPFLICRRSDLGS